MRLVCKRYGISINDKFDSGVRLQQLHLQVRHNNTHINPVHEKKMEMYNLHELRNLQSPNSSSQFPYLASQTLRIAEEINKHPPLKPDFLRMMFYNLRAIECRWKISNMLYKEYWKIVIQNYLGSINYYFYVISDPITLIHRCITSTTNERPISLLIERVYTSQGKGINKFLNSDSSLQERENVKREHAFF